MRPFLFPASLSFLLGLGAFAVEPLRADPLFTRAPFPANTSGNSMGAAFGDFDKDGDLDLVIAVENGANRLYLNNGQGVFTQKSGAFGTTSYDTEDVGIADFNGDGNLDVVFVMEDTRTYQLWLGDGQANFQNASSGLPRFGEANSVAVADLNGDGLPDLVIGNARYNTTTMNGQDYLFINDSLNPGTFLDQTAARMPVSTDMTQDIKLADLDGDGDLDMVVSNEVPPNKLYINLGGGYFADSSANLALPVSLETRESLLFDADGDGDLDIVFANLTCNACNVYTKDPQMRILINNGKARFTDETAARMPVNTFSSWGAGYLDFDGDGDKDLIVSAITVPGFTAQLRRAYRNNGQGVFTDATSEVLPSDVSGRGWKVVVADVDKNGTLDLFLTGFNTQNILLLGTVQQPVSVHGSRPARPASPTSFSLKGSRWVSPDGRTLDGATQPGRGVPALPAP